MEWKPKITGRPGAYECRGAEAIGYGETPAEAWEWWRRGIALRPTPEKVTRSARAFGLEDLLPEDYQNWESVGSGEDWYKNAVQRFIDNLTKGERNERS